MTEPYYIIGIDSSWAKQDEFASTLHSFSADKNLFCKSRVRAVDRGRPTDRITSLGGALVSHPVLFDNLVVTSKKLLFEQASMRLCLSGGYLAALVAKVTKRLQAFLIGYSAASW